MERKTIYLCLAHMSETGLEQKYIKEAFDTNWVVPLGPNVNAFEKDLETFVGEDKKVVALSAGTAAVQVAVWVPVMRFVCSHSLSVLVPTPSNTSVQRRCSSTLRKTHGI